jgi:hypothetical protein
MDLDNTITLFSGRQSVTELKPYRNGEKSETCEFVTQLAASFICFSSRPTISLLHSTAWVGLTVKDQYGILGHS